MKKTLLFLLAFLTMGEAAKAQTISVADVEAVPGKEAAFTVDLTGGKDTKYTAFQFDVQFPATGFTTTGDYSVSPSWPGASATVGSVDGTGLATVPFASSNEIIGTDVEGLVTVFFEVDENVDYGDYDVTLKNISLGYNFSDKDYPAEVNFKVKVVDRITLDENSKIAPLALKGVNVKVNRTIKANEWSTICLPFAIKSSPLKTIFGNDVQVMSFTSYSAEMDTQSSKCKAITMNFGPSTNIKAGTPYLIKTSKDINSFVLDAVNIVATTSDETVEEEDNDELEGTFKGTFAKTTVPDKGLFISGNKFYYSTGKTNIKAFRGWFELDAVLNESVSADTRIGFNFDETTGIKEVHGSNKSVEGTYDLQGRKVEESTNKGLYIVNGHKVVIK